MENEAVRMAEALEIIKALLDEHAFHPEEGLVWDGFYGTQPAQPHYTNAIEFLFKAGWLVEAGVEGRNFYRWTDAALKPLLAAPTADEAGDRPKAMSVEHYGHNCNGLIEANKLLAEWWSYAYTLESRLSQSTGKPAPLLAEKGDA